MTKNDRAKSVEKIMRLAWDSLETHLRYTHIKTTEGANFHKKTIKEYIEIISEASKLY